MATFDMRQLATFDDVREYLREGYRASGSADARRNLGYQLRFGFEWGRLPFGVAELGPLIERAVEIAGADGLTLQKVRALFDDVGRERFDRGLAFARTSGRVIEQRERRPNRAGRTQEQVVLRVAET